ncbi:class III lanthionine synthetase LanKC [Nocardia sp. NPDC050697]|uniref:class III lanthionine synthetase LanKC n=1 Tax=Nocardia sp. NPDC050697 TaxID=3155158 RepID=UPI0033D60952
MDFLFEQMTFGIAHSDYYLPITASPKAADPIAPTARMPHWCTTVEDVWRGWHIPTDPPVPGPGWKLHISSTYDDIQETLDITAAACSELRVPFKHLADRFFFLWLHHKYASRAQSGKFITLYPADVGTADTLMRELDTALGERPGPFVLTDRRYGRSKVVHYRYGAFRRMMRRDPVTGAEIPLLGADGEPREDSRQPRFELPPGVSDPFERADRGAARAPGPGLARYRVTEAIRHSNGGGVYRAVDGRTGRPVLVKEARAHTGLSWDRRSAKDRLRNEHRILSFVATRAPGLCPEPLDYFTEWEHEYLVTEWIEGETLHRWIMDTMPLVRFAPAPADSSEYFEQCLRYLADLRTVLDRLHGFDVEFGDLNPKNVIVDRSGAVRLVDFEAATLPGDDRLDIGTPGYLLPRSANGSVHRDHYALAAIARCMIFSVHTLMERSSTFWPAAKRDAARVADIPPRLWREAGRYLTENVLAPPADFSARRLHSWMDGLLHGIHATRAETGAPWIFPPSYQGLRSNTACFAYGTAGVVSTLQLAEGTVPDDLVADFAREAMGTAAELGDGLYFGTAGVATALAGVGHEELALELVQTGADPLPGSLATGAIGRALAGIDLFCRTGDEAMLRYAETVGRQAVRAGRDGTEVLHDSARVGLLHGHAGVALVLHCLTAVTGDSDYSAAGSVLLDRDLAARMALPDTAISMPDRIGGRRAMPYLGEGSAGVGVVTALYGLETPAVLSGLARDTHKLFTLNAGLYSGLAGLLFFHNELEHRLGAPHPTELATALDKYLVPTDRGLLVLGDGGSKYSADVWSGASGILRALDALRHGPGVPVPPATAGRRAGPLDEIGFCLDGGR